MKNYTYVFAKKLSLLFLAMFICSVLPASAAISKLAPPTPAPAPTSVHFDPSGTGVDGKVLWVYNDVVTGSNEFIVQQSINAGPMTTIGSPVPYTGGTDYDLPVTGLINGSTYTWQVLIRSDDGGLTLLSPYSAPSSPLLYSSLTGSTSVSEQNKNDNSITVNIVDGVTGETGYRIYIKESGAGAYSLFRTLVLGSPEQFVQITGLKANTNYQIYVEAFNGTNAKVSNTISVKTKRALPPKPISFTVSNLCPEKATINFIYADLSQFDEWELKSGSNIIGFGLPGTSSFQMPGVQPGKTYNLTVVAKNETGLTVSDVLTFTAPVYEAPLGPYNITDPYNVTTSEMTVAWLNGAEDWACFNRIRNSIDIFVHIVKRDGTVEDRIDFTYAGSTNYTVPNLPMKATVTIRLAAQNSLHGLTGFGDRSVTATTLGPPYAPSNLGGTSGKDALGDNEIVLTWKDNADDETGSTLEIGDGAGGFKHLATIDKDMTTFVHKPVQAGVTYIYRIKSFNQYGDSEYSATFSITPSATAEPHAPFNLRAVKSTEAINLTWQDDSNNESGFEVNRSTDAGVTWTKIGNTERNVTWFTDANVTDGTKYWYGVRSTNEVGSSDMVITSITYGTAASGLINVFPNPAVDVINLRVDNAGQGTVSLINQANRRVLSKSVDFGNGDISLDVSRFAPGAYQLIINTGETQISKKIYKY